MTMPTSNRFGEIRHWPSDPYGDFCSISWNIISLENPSSGNASAALSCFCKPNFFIGLAELPLAEATAIFL